MLDPVASYDLEMSSSFGRALLIELLNLVSSGPFFKVLSMTYTSAAGDASLASSASSSSPSPSLASASGVSTPIEIRTYVDKALYLSDVDKEAIKVLKKHIEIGNDPARVKQIFQVTHCSS